MVSDVVDGILPSNDVLIELFGDDAIQEYNNHLEAAQGLDFEYSAKDRGKDLKEFCHSMLFLHRMNVNKRNDDGEGVRGGHGSVTEEIFEHWEQLRPEDRLQVTDGLISDGIDGDIGFVLNPDWMLMPIFRKAQPMMYYTVKAIEAMVLDAVRLDSGSQTTAVDLQDKLTKLRKR